MLALLLLPFAVTDYAHARHHSPCMRAAADLSKVTPEQKKILHELMQKTCEERNVLEGEIFVKKNELKALHNASFPSVDAIGKKASEINELHKKIRDGQRELGNAIDKTLGLEPGTHNFGSCMKMHRGKRDGHGMHGRKMHHERRGGPHGAMMGDPKHEQRRPAPPVKNSPPETQDIPKEEHVQGL